MDLDSVAQELYAASPDDFVQRRTQRVTEARGARDRPLAKAISQLRRPTRSAWMVNLLSLNAPEEVRRLLDLGSALAEAQQRADGAELRRLSRQRHGALDDLTRRATELAAVAGHAATETTRQEVSQTLQAALADPAVAALVRTARVTQPVTYGGFGPLELFAPAASPQTESGPAVSADPVLEPIVEASPAPDPDPHPHPPEDPALLLAEAAVREAAEAVETAEQEGNQAAEDAEQATRQADELAEAVEALREQLADAETAEGEARALARAARKRAQQHQQLVTDARQALTVAQQSLPAHRPHEAARVPSPPDVVLRPSISPTT